jgi:hypothetical protein
MIKVNFIGRLGNNMIQYSIAKFIADKKNEKLCYSVIGNNSAHLMFQIFPKTNIENFYEDIDKNVKIIGYDNLKNQIQNFNIQELLEYKGDICLNGFFQKKEFFFNNYEIIKDYFKYNFEGLKNSNEYDVVIHLRLGDYVSLNHYIDPNKIYDLYKTLNFKKSLILTDDANSSLLEVFKKDPNCDIQLNSILQDLHYMITSKNIIISQSTFSWWGSYLNPNAKVYVPYSDINYPWPIEPNEDDIDLIPNFKNYKKIKL